MSSEDPDKSAATALLPFPNALGIEMVDLYVGPTKQHFRVHKALLCKKVPYFTKMFEGGFKEAIDNSATFPEDNANAFDLLIEWIYTGRIRELAVGGTSSSHAYFYTLAEKFVLSALKDEILNMFRAFEKNHNKFMRWTHLAVCWQIASSNSGLRLYVKRCCIYILMQLKSFEQKKVWSSSGFLKLAKKHDDLHLEVLDGIREHVHAGTSPNDPRTEPACDYHSHGKDEECLLIQKMN